MNIEVDDYTLESMAKMVLRFIGVMYSVVPVRI